jgi:hypothetical protein
LNMERLLMYTTTTRVGATYLLPPLTPCLPILLPSVLVIVAAVCFTAPLHTPDAGPDSLQHLHHACRLRYPLHGNYKHIHHELTSYIDTTYDLFGSSIAAHVRY